MNQIKNLVTDSRAQTEKTGQHHVTLNVTFKKSKSEAELIRRLFPTDEDGVMIISGRLKDIWYDYSPILVLYKMTGGFILELWDVGMKQKLAISDYSAKERKVEDALRISKQSLEALDKKGWVPPKGGLQYAALTLRKNMSWGSPLVNHVKEEHISQLMARAWPKGTGYTPKLLLKMTVDGSGFFLEVQDFVGTCQVAGQLEHNLDRIPFPGYAPRSRDSESAVAHLEDHLEFLQLVNWIVPKTRNKEDSWMLGAEYFDLLVMGHLIKRKKVSVTMRCVPGGSFEATMYSIEPDSFGNSNQILMRSKQGALSVKDALHSLSVFMRSYLKHNGISC